MTGDFTFTIQATKDVIATGSRTYTVSIKPAPVIGAITGHAGYTGTLAIGRGVGPFSIVGKPTEVPAG